MRVEPSLRAAAAGFVACVASGHFAGAQDVQRVQTYHAAAGQPIKIGEYGRVDRRCMPTGQPLITATGGPSHGAVTTTPGTHVMKHSIGNRECDGREIADLHVFYTPAAGFQGTDGFRLTVRFHDALVIKDITVVVE